INHFINQIGTDKSISFYKFTNEFYSKLNSRNNKRIIHRFRSMLINRDKFEYAQILSNAGFKNVISINSIRMYWYKRDGEENIIRGINTTGKTPSQILNAPKSIIRKLLSINVEEGVNPY